MYYNALTSTPPLHCRPVTVMTVNGTFWPPYNNLQRVVKSQTTRQMSNRFIYIQNCLQQGFWINIDPWGDICIQVHDTSCIIVSSQQREGKKPFYSTLIQKTDAHGAVWKTVRHKTQHPQLPLDLHQTPSSQLHTQQSPWYSLNYPLQMQQGL